VRWQALHSLAALDRGLALRHVTVIAQSQESLSRLRASLKTTPQEDAVLAAEFKALDPEDPSIEAYFEAVGQRHLFEPDDEDIPF
jgi:hypothetical protein